ncbi:MAG: hypothetical protein Ta2F_14590 [Termitinemataceae bacterium]|nr:MAG: hypothetical protein Ta2F_14590 [Termitinemataceae bacterium]
MIQKIKRNGGQRKIFLYSLFFVLYSLPVSVYAQEKKHITQDEAVQLAIKNNLSLESQRITTAGQKRKSDLFWNQFIPSVGLTGSFTVDNQAPADSQTALRVDPSMPHITTPYGDLYNSVLSTTVPMDVSRWHIGANMEVSLNLAIFALGAGIKSLKLDYQNGLITYNKAKQQLERDVRKSYNQILLMEEQYRQQSESLKNAKEQAESARINYQAGRSPQLQWMQAEVAAKNKQPAIDQIRNNLKMLKNQLAMNCGIEFNIEIELEPVGNGSNIVVLDTQDFVKKALDNKPDVLEMKAQLKTVQMQRKAQLLGHWTPALALSWRSQNIFTKIKEPESQKTEFFTGDHWNKSGGFTAALAWTPTNLLPFSQNYQSVKALDDNISKLSIGLTQLMQSAELEIYNNVFNLEQTRISMEAQQATVELAQRSYNETVTAYRNGLQDLLHVENAELQLRDAEYTMEQQRVTYINGLIDLEYAIGVPFGTYSLMK